jgi:pimeloyl-ACP methyl ester carboxylesterase
MEFKGKPVMKWYTRLPLAVVGLFVVLLVAATVASAQPQPKPPPPKPATNPTPPPAGPKKPEEAKKTDEDKPPPAPERVTLETKDGVILNCVYYGPKEGIREPKQTVPIIMIHGWGGQGADYDLLARGLQTYGHAIIVPDLRGHGRSVKLKIPGGEEKTIDRDKMTAKELETFVNDIEATKKFLLEKNNKGELNIELLTVIGAEEGCIIAMNWALLDWSWQQLPNFKQGQDVKALVLLSPTRQFKSLNANLAAVNPIIGGKLSKLVLVGAEDSRASADAKRLYNGFERLHPPLPSDPEKKRAQQDLFYLPAPTSLQGTKLLARELPVNRQIVGFIDLRIVRKAEDFPWKERTNPLGG